MRKFGGPKKDYIKFQNFGMLKHWGSSFRTTKMRSRDIEWRGKICPTPLSDEYEISIKYSLGSFPDVRVLSPILKSGPKGEPIPHVYPENLLCLYLPQADEWTREMLIAETTLPWASLWLYHYEVWQSTGVWMGGGVHPSQFEQKKNNNFDEEED